MYNLLPLLALLLVERQSSRAVVSPPVAQRSYTRQTYEQSARTSNSGATNANKVPWPNSASPKLSINIPPRSQYIAPRNYYTPRRNINKVNSGWGRTETSSKNAPAQRAWTTTKNSEVVPKSAASPWWGNKQRAVQKTPQSTGGVSRLSKPQSSVKKATLSINPRSARGQLDSKKKKQFIIANYGGLGLGTGYGLANGLATTGTGLGIATGGLGATGTLAGTGTALGLTSDGLGTTTGALGTGLGTNFATGLGAGLTSSYGTGVGTSLGGGYGTAATDLLGTDGVLDTRQSFGANYGGITGNGQGGGSLSDYTGVNLNSLTSQTGSNSLSGLNSLLSSLGGETSEMNSVGSYQNNGLDVLGNSANTASLGANQMSSNTGVDGIESLAGGVPQNQQYMSDDMVNSLDEKLNMGGGGRQGIGASMDLGMDNINDLGGGNSMPDTSLQQLLGQLMNAGGGGGGAGGAGGGGGGEGGRMGSNSENVGADLDLSSLGLNIGMGNSMGNGMGSLGGMGNDMSGGNNGMGMGGMGMGMGMGGMGNGMKIGGLSVGGHAPGGMGNQDDESSEAEDSQPSNAPDEQSLPNFMQRPVAIAPIVPGQTVHAHASDKPKRPTFSTALYSPAEMALKVQLKANREHQRKLKELKMKLRRLREKLRKLKSEYKYSDNSLDQEESEKSELDTLQDLKKATEQAIRELQVETNRANKRKGVKKLIFIHNFPDSSSTKSKTLSGKIKSLENLGTDLLELIETDKTGTAPAKSKNKNSLQIPPPARGPQTPATKIGAQDDTPSLTELEKQAEQEVNFLTKNSPNAKQNSLTHALKLRIPGNIPLNVAQPANTPRKNRPPPPRGSNGQLRSMHVPWGPNIQNPPVKDRKTPLTGASGNTMHPKQNLNFPTSPQVMKMPGGQRLLNRIQLNNLAQILPEPVENSRQRKFPPSTPVGMKSNVTHAPDYFSIGCWRDQPERALSSVEGIFPILDGNDYQRRKFAIKKCATIARVQGFPAFALENGGQCLGGKDILQTYNMYGASGACKPDGKGGPWSMEIYKFTRRHMVSSRRGGIPGLGNQSFYTGRKR